MVRRCIAFQSNAYRLYPVATLTSCTLPSTKVNRKGKNTAKSRLGVILNWILLQQTNVATILKNPLKKERNTTSGRKSETMHR